MKTTIFIGCALIISSSVALAQEPVSANLLQDGQKYFSEKCAACHGEDAGGAEMGPKLLASRRLRSRSEQQLRSLIEQYFATVAGPNIVCFGLP